MRKTTKKIVAVLSLIAIMVSALSVSAMAANRYDVKQYPVYVCLGDSVASGFGLPDYNRRGKVLVYRKNIQGSYGNLLSKDVGAKRYYPCGYPGFTSAIFRYCLTDNYTPREWEINQLQNFSYNDYSPEVLNRERTHIRNAVAKADLITVDLGVNDTWYSTIALVYEIAKYGTVVGVDPRKTLAEELAIYGSWGTVARNAMYYLAGFAENPQLWATFWGWWVENLSTYFLQYQANFDAIMDGIFKLNPDVTVVNLASGNSFRCLSIIPGVRSGSLKLQWMDKPVQVDLPFVGTFTLPNFVHVSENPIANVTGVMYDFFYEPIRQAWTVKKPGQVFYADVTDYEMIMKNQITIPMYEFMSMDDSAFNPHATLAGNRYMADKILEVLPTR
ncbi:MAG: hypothetical protein E7567_01005 [Ruminococcaceae bacterium]|nr:hypothetical protein [Oscillospiraceae bacterium]